MGCFSCTLLPKMSPPTQSSCQERRSKGPRFMKDAPLKLARNISRTRNWEITQSPILTYSTLFHPHCFAAQNAQGVNNEKRIYIGKMSINGGWKTKARPARIAAPGFLKY